MLVRTYHLTIQSLKHILYLGTLDLSFQRTMFVRSGLSLSRQRQNFLLTRLKNRVSILNDGKKGASLLTTKNITCYGHEIRPALKRIFKKLYKLNGKVVFVGQVKPEGSRAETGESTFDRSSHVLRQIIKEIAEYADHQNEDVLIFLDSVDTKAREEALSVSASFIYASNSPESVKRVLEAPMQLESHFYGTTQFADWICALLGRAAHYHFVKSSEFSWAPKLLNDMLSCSGDHSSTTVHSRIQPYQSNRRNKKSIKVGSLCRSDKYVDSFSRPLQNIGDMNPDLREFYKSLDKNRL